MATIVQTKPSSANIRVALIIESGKLKPVWFEQTDNRASDRLFIKEICSVWTHHQGSAKIITFAVRAGGNGYQLSLNTQDHLDTRRGRGVTIPRLPLVGTRIEIMISGVVNDVGGTMRLINSALTLTGGLGYYRPMRHSLT